jgi:glc operon protein GlcG
MRNKPCLTLGDAQRMAIACREAAARHDQDATIAVVDDGGHLIYLERPDQHRPNAVDMATLKARSAALRARPSSTLEERVKERPGFLMVPNSLAIRGGVPVFYAGECVGGVGISGADTLDETIAEAGANALGM